MCFVVPQRMIQMDISLIVVELQYLSLDGIVLRLYLCYIGITRNCLLYSISIGYTACLSGITIECGQHVSVFDCLYPFNWNYNRNVIGTPITPMFIPIWNYLR